MELPAIAVVLTLMLALCVNSVSSSVSCAYFNEHKKSITCQGPSANDFLNTIQTFCYIASRVTDEYSDILQVYGKLDCKNDQNLTTINAEWFEPNNNITNVYFDSLNIEKIDSESFNNVPNLTSLFIYDNRNELVITPDAFKNVPKLRHLVLFGSNVSTFELGPDILSIEKLFMDNNNLTKINATTFATLPELIKLEISHNKISSIEYCSFCQLNKVTDIYLSRNLLTELPMGLDLNMTALRSMDLTYNRIYELREGIFVEPNSIVLSLNFKGNMITTIGSGTFKTLRTLTYLSLDRNQIHSIHENVFAGLNFLQSVNLSRNKLTFVPEKLFQELPYLISVTMSRNQLTTLPDNLFLGSPFLQELTVHNNKITDLPYELFKPIQQLERLYINNNHLSFLPAEFWDVWTRQQYRYRRSEVRKYVIFFFYGNPWQCPCLEDITDKLKERHIEYDFYDGGRTDYFDDRFQRLVCVHVPESNNRCIREPSLTKNFSDVFFWAKDRFNFSLYEDLIYH